MLTALILSAALCAAPPLVSIHAGGARPRTVDCEPCLARWDLDDLGTTLLAGPVPGDAPVDSAQWRLDPLHDDAVVRGLALGFPFPFYYDRYDSVAVGVNGFLSFLGNDLPSIAGDRPAPLPCPIQPHAIVAPFWSDLVLGGEGTLYFKAGADSAVVEWHRLRDVSGDGPYTFQVRLLPSGAIRLIWIELPATLAEHVVGLGDARGIDGMSISETPGAGAALTLTRPVQLEGLAALEISSPVHGLTLGEELAPEIVVANPGTTSIAADAALVVTRLADSVVVAGLEPALAVDVAAGGQATFAMEEWTPSRTGRYRLEATIRPALALDRLEAEVLASGPRDTVAALGGFKATEPADAFALLDPGEWAIRFLPDTLAETEAALVRVSFWEGWPDTEGQVFEVELFATGSGGGPAESGLHAPVTATGAAGFVAVPLPEGIVVGDTIFVVLRQLLPFPDCDGIVSDADQKITLYPRHWARSCAQSTWQKLEASDLLGDLFVELYLASPVGVAAGAPGAPRVRSVAGGKVEISWERVMDARGYSVLRSAPAAGPWRVVAELAATETRHFDEPPPTAQTLRYAVAAIDAAGLARISPGVEMRFGGPRLLPPSPVPANPRVTIRADLPAGADQASLAVYDLGGRVVRILQRGNLSPGVHRFAWNGEHDGGRPVPSGVYLVRLEADGVVDTRRVIILR